MSNVELKHKWHVSQKAWYIRFYVWLWMASEKDINFCKLFWGYVFIPVGLPLHFIVWVCIKIAHWVQALQAKRVKKLSLVLAGSGPSIPEATVEEVVFEGPGFMSRILDKIGMFFTRVGMWCQKHQDGIATTGVALLIIMAGLTAGGLIYLIITNFSEFLRVLGITALCVAGVAVLVLMIALIKVLGDRWAAKRRTKVKDPNKLTFRKLIRHGFRAVKSNTCPQIILKE